MTKTVLVVDDDPTQRRLIQAVLERDGFAVSHAESGREALDRLATAGADVVLLDLNMPGLSGMETMADMRSRGFAQPVIVVTATGGIDTGGRSAEPAGPMRAPMPPLRKVITSICW